MFRFKNFLAPQSLILAPLQSKSALSWAWKILYVVKKRNNCAGFLSSPWVLLFSFLTHPIIPSPEVVMSDNRTQHFPQVLHQGIKLCSLSLSFFFSLCCFSFICRCMLIELFLKFSVKFVHSKTSWSADKPILFSKDNWAEHFSFHWNLVVFEALHFTDPRWMMST